MDRQAICVSIKAVFVFGFDSGVTSNIGCPCEYGPTIYDIISIYSYKY